MAYFGTVKVLFVDANQGMVGMVERAKLIMSAAGLEFECRRVDSQSVFAAALDEIGPDVIISDSREGGKSSNNAVRSLASCQTFIQCDEESFVAILEETKDMIFVVDLQTMEIERVSGAAAEFCGRASGELVGRKISDIDPLDEASVRDGLQKVASLQQQHFFLKHYGSDGEVLDFEIFSGLMHRRSQVLICLLVHDLREKSRNEDRLRMLALEITKTEERERRRFASYLHDEIGQNLAMLKMTLDVASRAHSSAAIGDEFRQIAELLDRTIAQTRTMIFDLSPPALYKLGLSSALRCEGENICRENHIEFIFLAEEIPPLPDDRGILVFRCIQELMRNCLHHANASCMTLSLRGDGQRIAIRLSDDGVGFDVSCLENNGTEGGFGLFSVRERIRGIGGSVTIVSRIGDGTCIDLVAPIN